MEAFELAPRPASRPSCRVRVGRGALAVLVDDLAREPPARLFVLVSDERVGPLHGRPLAERLARSGLRVELVTLPRGERAKTREIKAEVEDRLLFLGAGRDSAVLAVGGGAVGDLAGFVAATWHRGIPVIQVPTTLLAMADAALGGKTGVNLDGLKNAVGCFHQPWGVYADVALLGTLDEPDYRAGFAEVVKAAAVADAGLFRDLEVSAAALGAREPETLERVLGRSLRIKARVVRQDERETGRRALLNFGHTVGHALEAASGYALPHGRAVAIGLAVECRLAERLTGFPARHSARLARTLAALGLSPRLPAGLDAAAVVEAARRDKKNREGAIHCALPLAIGRMPRGDAVTVPVSEAELRAALVDPRGRDAAV